MLFKSAEEDRSALSVRRPNGAMCEGRCRGMKARPPWEPPVRLCFFHNRVTVSALTSRMGKGHTMRVLGYLGIGFLIVWLVAPTPMAVADTVTIEPDGTQSLSQPAREEDLLNLED